MLNRDRAGGRLDGRELFLSEIGRIDRIIAAIAQSRALDSDDTDDFASFVHGRLIANDYAILGKFEGRSSLKTYLGVVITRLFLDFRNAQWGRWRPSAAARTMGSWAVRLESLIAREGWSVHEAVQAIRTSFPEAPGEAELRAMAAHLPKRPPAGPSLRLHDAVLPAADTADDTIRDGERNRVRQQVTDALQQSLEVLSAEDRLILQLRFWQNLSVAEIARMLRLEQKPLYRRIESCLRRLRARLEAAGISGSALAEWEIGE